MKKLSILILLSISANWALAQYKWHPEIKEDVKATMRNKVSPSKAESVANFMALNFAGQKIILEKGVKEMVDARILSKLEAGIIIKSFVATCTGDFKTSLNEYAKIYKSSRKSPIGNIVYNEMNDMIHNYGYQSIDAYLADVSKIEPIELYDSDVFSDIQNPFGNDAIDLPSLMQSNIMMQQFGTQSLAKNGDLVMDGLKFGLGVTTGGLYALLDAPNYIGGNANLPKAFKEGYKDGQYLGDKAEEFGKRLAEEDGIMDIPCREAQNEEDCLDAMIFGSL